MELKDLSTLLAPHSPGYLATVDENGKPDVRGFEWQGVIDNKLVLITSDKKNVFKQIQNNGNIAYFAQGQNGTFIRVYAKATHSTDAALVQKVWDNCNDNVKQFYPTPKDNGFAVLHLTDGHITVAAWGQETKEIKF